MMNEVVKYGEKWAADAEAYARQEVTGGGTFLSLRAGVLRFGEEEMPGNQICAVILDSVRENVYYPGKFNPELTLPPVCYAFGRSDAEMAPHPSMQVSDYFVPQSGECATCPKNQWGSADTGRGKACGNRRRLALIPAGYYTRRKGSRDFDLRLFDETAHFAESDIVFLKLPVTSGKSWARYVQQVAANLQRPPYAVITRIYVEPDARTQFHVGFEIIDVLPDEFAEAVMMRHREARDSIIRPYSPPEDE